jgi:hypothetical protein
MTIDLLETAAVAEVGDGQLVELFVMLCGDVAQRRHSSPRN